MMPINERAEAIGRAQRALKALGEHPRSSKKQLGAAREHLNDCYRLTDGERVWQSVHTLEANAAWTHGVPRNADLPGAAEPITRPEAVPVSTAPAPGAALSI